MDKKADLIELFKEVVFYGEYKLSSGGTTDYFIDASRVLLNGKGLRYVTDMIWEMMDPQNNGGVFDLLEVSVFGGVMSGADSLVGGLLHLSFDQGYESRGFLVRKDGKIEGCLEAGDEVILIDDVLTTGTQVLNAATAVETKGAKVAAIFSVVDRLTGARENIEGKGYKYYAILTVEDLEIGMKNVKSADINR